VSPPLFVIAPEQGKINLPDFSPLAWHVALSEKLIQMDGNRV
jgi:hypothetical protein